MTMEILAIESVYSDKMQTICGIYAEWERMRVSTKISVNGIQKKKKKKIDCYFKIHVGHTLVPDFIT